MEKAGKILALSLLGLFMISLVAGVVSAGFWENTFRGTRTTGDEIGDFFRSVIDGIEKGGEPIFEALLGKATTGGDLFIKVLLFLLVVFIIVAVLGSISFFIDKTWLTWLIAIVVSIFGIRFIPAGLIKTVTIPSSALALIIGLGLPFLIFGYVIEKIENSFVRRAGWTVFAVIILFLWFYNWNNPELDKFRWIYLLAIVACAFAFWFDGTLQRLWGKARAAKTVEKVTDVQKDRIIAEIRDLQGALAAATNARDAARIKRQINYKESRLKGL